MDHPIRIALLRGINVGGHNRIPMAELRAPCDRLVGSPVTLRNWRTVLKIGELIERASI